MQNTQEITSGNRKLTLIFPIKTTKSIHLIVNCLNSHAECRRSQHATTELRSPISRRASSKMEHPQTRNDDGPSHPGAEERKQRLTSDFDDGHPLGAELEDAMKDHSLAFNAYG